MSVLNTNSNFIYGDLMGFALSMLTLQVHANTAFSVLYLGLTIASIVCIVLEIHWKKKTKRLKDELVDLIDQAVNQEANDEKSN